MPRLEGLGHMHGGSFAATFGLGANALTNPAIHSRAVISLLDFPCTVVTATDAGPATCIALGELSAATLVTCVDAGPATSITTVDGPSVIITSADGKDG